VGVEALWLVVVVETKGFFDVHCSSASLRLCAQR
jgi:hypothetical protein